MNQDDIEKLFGRRPTFTIDPAKIPPGVFLPLKPSENTRCIKSLRSVKKVLPGYAQKRVHPGRKTPDAGRQSLENGQKLEKGLQTLDNERRGLDKGFRMLNIGRRELDNECRGLDNGGQKLDNGGQKLDTGGQKLDNGGQKLDNGLQTLDNERRRLAIGHRRLDNGRQSLENRRLNFLPNTGQEQKQRVKTQNKLVQTSAVTEKLARPGTSKQGWVKVVGYHILRYLSFGALYTIAVLAKRRFLKE